MSTRYHAKLTTLNYYDSTDQCFHINISELLHNRPQTPKRMRGDKVAQQILSSIYKSDPGFKTQDIVGPEAGTRQNPLRKSSGATTLTQAETLLTHHASVLALDRATSTIVPVGILDQPGGRTAGSSQSGKRASAPHARKERSTKNLDQHHLLCDVKTWRFHFVSDRTRYFQRTQPDCLKFAQCNTKAICRSSLSQEPCATSGFGIPKTKAKGTKRAKIRAFSV